MSCQKPRGEKQVPLLLLTYQGILPTLLTAFAIPPVLSKIQLLPTNDLEAARLIQHKDGAIILADLALNQLAVLGVLNALRRYAVSQPAIVAFNLPMQASSLRRAIRAGALGCLTSDAPMEELRRGLSAALNRRHFYSGSAKRLLGLDSNCQEISPAGNRLELWAAADRVPALTVREREVLVSAVAHLRNKDIAVQLGISTATVQSHMHHVLTKLGARSRRELSFRWPRFQSAITREKRTEPA